MRKGFLGVLSFAFALTSLAQPVSGPLVSTNRGVPVFTQTNGKKIDPSPVYIDAIGSLYFGGPGTVIVNDMTTAERNLLSATNGMVIYNTTAAKLQMRENGAWVDIGTSAATGVFMSNFDQDWFRTNGSIVRPALTKTLPSWVNVADVAYGATPNNSADDDAPAFQSAVNAVGAAGGGVVYVPIGTYHWATAINLTNNMTLRFDSGARIVRKANTPAINVGMIGTDNTAFHTNLTIIGGVWDGNKQNNTNGYGLNLAGVNILVRDVTVTNFPWNGIALGYHSTPTLVSSNCYVESSFIGNCGLVGENWGNASIVRGFRMGYRNCQIVSTDGLAAYGLDFELNDNDDNNIAGQIEFSGNSVIQGRIYATGNVNSNGYPDTVVIRDNFIDARGAAVALSDDNAPALFLRKLKNLTVTGNTAHGFDNAANTTTGRVATVRNVFGGKFTGNHLHVPDVLAGYESGIGFIDASTNITITGNTFESLFAGAPLSYAISGGALVYNLNISDNPLRNLLLTDDNRPFYTSTEQYLGTALRVGNGRAHMDDVTVNTNLQVFGESSADVFLGQKYQFPPPFYIVLSGDAFTADRSHHWLDTEGLAATDNLSTINGLAVDGTILIISPANDARTIVLQHNVGNILCQGNVDLQLDDVQDFAILMYDANSSGWFAMMGSGVGEVNTTLNLGTQSATVQGLAKGKDGVTNLFRSIEAGANITLTSNANTLTITSTGGGGGGGSGSLQNSTVTGSGTDYTITDTYALVDFGAGDPTHTLPAAGTYLLVAHFSQESANTFVKGFKFRDTTASADVPGSEIFEDYSGGGHPSEVAMHAIYTSPGANTVQLWAKMVDPIYGGTHVVWSTNCTFSYVRLDGVLGFSVNAASVATPNFQNTSATGTVPSSTIGATGTNFGITIGPASATEAGVVTTGTQTMAGNKTLQGSLSVSNALNAYSGKFTNTVDIDGIAAIGAISDVESEINGKALSGHTHSFGGLTTGTNAALMAGNFKNAVSEKADIETISGATPTVNWQTQPIKSHIVTTNSTYTDSNRPTAAAVGEPIVIYMTNSVATAATISLPSGWRDETGIGFTNLVAGQTATVVAHWTGTEVRYYWRTFEYPYDTVLTGAFTLATTDHGKLFNNLGASSLTTYTLPAADAGLSFEFAVADTDGIQITSIGNDTIRIGGSVTAVAASVQNLVIGGTLKLTAINSTNWYGLWSQGTWTF